MIGDQPVPFTGMCLACGEREATPDSFLCLVCCPVPQLDPEPEDADA